MLSWTCPKCGGVLDVTDVECPHCSESLASIEPAANRTSASGDSQPAAVSRRTDRPDPAPATAVLPVEVPEPSPEAEPAAGSNALGLQRRHYLLFAVALVVFVGAAVWLSGGFDDGIFGLRFEDPGEMDESPVETFAIGVRGDIEVSGVRPYYDDEYQAHVKLFVANHSDQERAVALRALMRVKEAGPRSVPIATFDVVTVPPLGPNEGRELDVSLNAMGTLQSFPRWDEMRVDLEPIGSTQQ